LGIMSGNKQFVENASSLGQALLVTGLLGIQACCIPATGEYAFARKQRTHFRRRQHRKLEAARSSMEAGAGQSNDEVEAELAARRASVTSQK